MQKQPHLVGLLGGTFDPVHLGHLHVADAVLSQVVLDEIRLLPCYQPVHRDQPMASTVDRINMLELAIATRPKLHIDRHEIDRQGPSYMIDTLKSLHTEEPSTHFCLIMGADAISKLDGWKDWRSLLDYCHFIVVNRPGYDGTNKTVQQFIKPNLCAEPDKLRTTHHGLVHYVEIAPSPISATALRTAVHEGATLESLVPTTVLNYIKKHKLYTSRR